MKPLLIWLSATSNWTKLFKLKNSNAATTKKYLAILKNLELNPKLKPFMKSHDKVANFNKQCRNSNYFSALARISFLFRHLFFRWYQWYIRMHHVPTPFSVILFIFLRCTNNTTVTSYANKIWNAVSTASLSSTKEISC